MRNCVAIFYAPDERWSFHTAKVIFDPAAVRDGCDGLQADIARLAQGVVQALV